MAQTTLLAVLAVFAASYQPAHDRSPQKPWAADGSANKRTVKRWLFRRCFSLSCQKVVPSREKILMTATISHISNFVNLGTSFLSPTKLGACPWAALRADPWERRRVERGG